MKTIPKSPTNAERLSEYLNELKPIPLNGVSPAPDKLACWAEQHFEWLNMSDTLADNAVIALRQAGISLKHPARALKQLADQGDAPCRALLADMYDTPSWVDYALMRRAGAMAQRQFPMLILALTYGGLPLTFAHPDAAEVFTGTGRMQANISRRLNESATLFLGIYNSDALAPGKPMWEICLQVRLVHSVVRMSLIHKGWDIEKRGVPINQLSTAAGPAFFGTHQLGCLRRLGARIDDDETLGFTMIWRYVTRLLGVPESLIGQTQDEQDEFDQHITSLFFAPDNNSRTVMHELIEGLATQKPTANVPRAMQLALFRLMLGDEMADAYGIERSLTGERQLKFMLPILGSYGWLQRAPLLSGVLQRTGLRCIQRVATEGVVRLNVAGGHH